MKSKMENNAKDSRINLFSKVLKILMHIIKRIKEFFNPIIKWKRLTPSDVIQIGVLIVLVLAICKTSENIRQQGEFNRNVFRPWVYIEPRQHIEVQDNRIIFWYDLRCDGESPAYRIIRHNTATFNSIFPMETFEKRDTVKKIGLIRPGTVQEIDDHCIINFEQQIASGMLIQNIINKSLFIHIYVEYLDFKNNPYGLKCTIIPKNLEEFAPNQYNCEWSFVYVLDE